MLPFRSCARGQDRFTATSQAIEKKRAVFGRVYTEKRRSLRLSSAWEAYDLTHPDGKTILVGVPEKGDNISIPSLPLHFNKVLTGSHGGGAEPDKDIPRIIRLMDAGLLNFEGLITHEFSLDDINEAIRMFRSGEAGRIILSMV